MPTKPRLVRSHRFTHKGKTLSARERGELAYTAGVDPASRDARVLSDEVEGVLSDAVNLRDGVERGPTSAAIAELLHQVEESAHALERALLDLDQGSLLQLDSPFVDDNDEPVVGDLVDLRSAARELRAIHLKESRRGRGAEGARDEAIKGLAWVFHERADASINGEYRAALISFIDIALSSAQFRAPGMRRKVGRKPDPTEGRKIWQRVPAGFKRPRKKP